MAQPNQKEICDLIESEMKTAKNNSMTDCERSFVNGMRYSLSLAVSGKIAPAELSGKPVEK